jgi:hypothetical protein
MKPMGTMHMNGANVAPTRPTKLEKMGIALPMMYATRVVPKVQPTHTIQCVGVFVLRWRDPRRTLTKMYLAGSWGQPSGENGENGVPQLTWV